MTTNDAIVISEVSLQSTDPSDIIQSNIDFTNALIEEHVAYSEISIDALKSYFVDYYLCQVENGGFSQFVYNSRWHPMIVKLVREGLQAMDAQRHLDIFQKGMLFVENMGNLLAKYLASEYFGENAIRDGLNTIANDFFEVNKSEDLRVMNAAWLRSHPKLAVLSPSKLREEIARRIAEIPDMKQRSEEAKKNEPRLNKVINALCGKAGYELLELTAGDPTYVHKGVPTVAWYFKTNKGLCHVVEDGHTAMMFREFSTTDLICEVDTSDL